MKEEEEYKVELDSKVFDCNEQLKELGELPELITFYSSMEDALQHMHNVTTLKEQIEEKIKEENPIYRTSRRFERNWYGRNKL